MIIPRYDYFLVKGLRGVDFIKNLFKKILPRYIKKHLKQILGYYKNKKKFTKKHRKTVYVIGTPEHNNLGDHAIAHTMMEFFHKLLPDFSIFEISLNEFDQYLFCIKKHITSKDKIVLIGGGNIGNEYLIEESVRRETIKAFSNHKIIIFPQTIYFTCDKKGFRELAISKKIYNRHSNLTIFAREIYSYEIMCKEFKNNKVILAPDIVLYLNKTEPKYHRDGLLLCLRDDKESKINDFFRAELLKCCKDYFSKVNLIDTCVINDIKINDREKELYLKLEEIKKAQIIITDRLHGLVFAAITSTPCIVLENYNHKIVGTYEWIKDLEYLKCINKVEQISHTIEYLLSLKNCEYNENNLLYFKKIEHEILCN